MFPNTLLVPNSPHLNLSQDTRAQTSWFSASHRQSPGWTHSGQTWCSFPPHHPTPIIQINITGKYPTKPHPTAIAQHGDLCTERSAAGQSPSLSPSSHSPPSTCAAAVKHADRSASEPLELWPQVHAALAFPAGQMMPIRTSGSSENTLLHQSRQECASEGHSQHGS